MIRLCGSVKLSRAFPSGSPYSRLYAPTALRIALLSGLPTAGLVLLKLARHSARGNHPRRVPVDQHLQHHPRLVRGLATPVALVRGVKRRQIQPLHQVANVVRKVALRLPIPHIRRQQQALLRVVGAKSRRHPSLLNNPVPVLSHPGSYGAHS